METIRFDELNLDPRILRAVTDMGFEAAFKYILCHVPLTAGLSHRGLVSGSFRTLTGSFATLGAVWLPD